MKLLEIQNISKNYKSIKAIQNISFSIEKNEIIGLLGLNGAGKSTTIGIIATLLKQDSGTVYYKGKDILKEPKYIKSEMGYVPQEIMLFDELSGMQNLEFWGKAYGLETSRLKNAIKYATEICELSSKINMPVSTYSGGMKRRLNIAVAIMHNPQFLILDEATVGIDLISAQKILEIIKKLNQTNQTSIIFTTHNMEEAEFLCSRFIILKEGKLIADISKEELKTTLKSYFLEQFQNKDI